MAPWICTPPLIIVILISCLVVPVRTQCRKSLTVYVNRTEQMILSPNYPDPYPRPSSCTWNLRATDDNDIIVLRYRYFSIYTSVFCYIDLFSVTDGDNGWLPELMSLCGSFSSRKLFRTTRPAAILSFTAVTNAGPADGFNISVWTEGKSVPKVGVARYDAINYIGMAISGCLAAALVVACGFLVYVHFKHQRDSRYLM